MYLCGKAIHVSRREGKAFKPVLGTPPGGHMSPSTSARFADAVNGLALVMFRELATARAFGRCD